jgi:hypothetical protein
MDYVKGELGASPLLRPPLRPSGLVGQLNWGPTNDIQLPSADVCYHHVPSLSHPIVRVVIADVAIRTGLGRA